MIRLKETILLFHHGAGLYGSDKIFLSIVKALSGKYRLVVLVGEKGPLTKVLKKYTSEVKVVSLGALKRKKSWPKMAVEFLESLYKLVSIVSDYRPKMIITNTLIVLSPVFVAKLMRIKNIWFVHEHPESKFEQVIFKLMLKVFAEKVVVPSESVKSWTGEAAEKIPYVEILESPSKSSVSKARAGLKINEKELILGCVGMLHPKKGQDYFIKIAKKMLEKRKDLKFVIIGGEIQGYEAYKKRLERLVQGFEDNFMFVSFSEEILAFISCFDVAVIPSLYEDPFPLVAQEAMFLGKAIAATNVGGLKELIIDNNNGVLLSLDDHFEAAKKLLKFIDSRQNLLYTGKKGKGMYKEKFNFDEFSESVRKLIGEKT